MDRLGEIDMNCDEDVCSYCGAAKIAYGQHGDSEAGENLSVEIFDALKLTDAEALRNALLARIVRVLVEAADVIVHEKDSRLVIGGSVQHCKEILKTALARCNELAKEANGNGKN